MAGVFSRPRPFLIATLAFSLAASVCAGAYAQKKPKKAKKTAPASDKGASAEPDKLLYDRAVTDIKRGHYTEGRLSFQTLINTYPDSEYLAKAKLGVADSYYKEGGTSNFTQAIQEYKDFITFFPFLDEAAYAQMQVAMAHYRMMEKSDRDTSQAQAAEDEFQTFLLKYPQSQLVSKAEQNLRDVQEVLADGEFRIARFYYVRQDYRASAARLMEASQRYPLYSQSDEALWMLGEVYSRAKQASRNEDDKNHWADLAAKCYDRIVRDYPLSKLAADAKSRLTAMGMPVPAADPEALARLQKQQMFAKKHHEIALLRLPLGMVRSSPDISAAARNGQPNLNPPDDAASATEVLKPGAAGPSFNLTAKPAADANPDSAGADTTPVDAETGPPPGTPTTGVAVQIIAAPTSDSTAIPSNSAAAAASTDPTPASGNGTPAPQSTQAAGDSNGQPSAQQSSTQGDPKSESSSKKKKGFKKMIPW